MPARDGGGGTRTPKGFRPPHFECGALPIRLRLRTNRVDRLWEGKAKLQPFSIGAPGFEPGTSATRTQRSTGLSHAPKVGLPPADGDARQLAASPAIQQGAAPWARHRARWDSQPRAAPSRPEGEPEDAQRRKAQPWVRTPPPPGRAPLASGRGGIRTHVGVSPHDFQSCALSHSATRPNNSRPRPLRARKGPPERKPWSGPQTEAVSATVGRGVTTGTNSLHPPEVQWDSQPRSGASRPDGEPRTRSAARLNRGFESHPSPRRAPLASGGGGIRTHETLSGQRLSRAPP